MSMTRSKFKKIWMLAVAICVIISLYMYQQGEKYQAKVMRQTSKKNQLSSTLRVGNKLSSDLIKLDNFTINERGVTKLDVLRFLGLENSNMNVSISGKTAKKTGKIPLFQRDFSMTGKLPYSAVLDQIDTIHNTKKVIITDISLQVPKKNVGDLVEFDIKGVLYGLDKK